MVTEHTSPWMKSTHFTKRLLEIGNKLLLEYRMGCLFDLHSRWIYNNNNNVYINITLDVPKNNLRSCFHTKSYFPQYDCRRRFFFFFFFLPLQFSIYNKYVYICWIYIYMYQEVWWCNNNNNKPFKKKNDFKMWFEAFFFFSSQLGLKWINLWWWEI